MREAGDKIEIELADGGRQRVRAKDIELLHPGPIANFAALEGGFSQAVARDAWELAVEEGAAFTLEELASLAGDWTAQSAWAAYQLLEDGLYFEGGLEAIRAKSPESVAAEAHKRQAKRAEGELRDAFLKRLRNKERLDALESLDDETRRFLQDVEALALGKTEKSRTLKELGLEETPENAHRLLLDTGVWTVWINPHPSRWGTPLSAPKAEAGAPPDDEERVDLTGLASFAIDDEGSTDPDDALSLEMTPQGRILFVHIADPSASATPDSGADLEARGRGATLYAPEGIARMLGDSALSHFALGLGETSPALTVRIPLGGAGSLDGAGGVGAASVFRSRIRVTRLSYAAASERPADAGGAADALGGLFALADENTRRRAAAGAVNITFPEVSISVSQGSITIEPVENYPSRALVRECMLLAG